MSSGWARRLTPSRSFCLTIRPTTAATVLGGAVMDACPTLRCFRPEDVYKYPIPRADRETDREKGRERERGERGARRERREKREQREMREERESRKTRESREKREMREKKDERRERGERGARRERSEEREQRDEREEREEREESTECADAERLNRAEYEIDILLFVVVILWGARRKGAN